MLEKVPQQVSFPELEERLLGFWRERRIFEQSVKQAEGRPRFVFYEGPPTANGLPHPGHVLTRVMKDVILRYRSMTGYHVPRRGGWDTHGLPVEVEVEKDLGIAGPPGIRELGVDVFAQKCMDSVFRYIDEWRRMTQRIAFWVDLDEAYVTFHKPYVESVWWALKTLFERGLLYQDYKVVWWWPQGGTALSSGEVGQGYREVEDPSVIVRFPVVGPDGAPSDRALLAWTTTPWTLPSNVALAVKPDATYVTVALPGEKPEKALPGDRPEKVVLAEALVPTVLGDGPHEIVERTLGRELVGLRYRPPFAYRAPEGGEAHRVVDADFVTLDSGSGLVHIAPAFGEDDFRLAKEKGLGFLQLVEPDGRFSPQVTDFAGRFCKEADRDIIRHLRRAGILFSDEVYKHDYPFCWRADDDPLIQYARRSWFVRTTQEIQRVIKNNAEVNWEPEHIKQGRFGEFLRNNVDWALSRERFWGTPLPIWVNDQTGRMEAVASVAEILEKNPQAFADFDAAQAEDPSLSEHLRVHKPWIDRVTWTRDGEPGVYRRVPEVIDCWFDSGCMPFAQHGYPHKNKARFEAEFPADFITEALDQTRGWFYSLIAVSTLLFPERALPHPYRNCTVLGLLTAGDGRKLSKRLKNYAAPQEMFDRYGADAVRWSLYAQSLPGQSARWFDQGAQDAVRDILLKVWNVYSFFVTYARIDAFDPNAPRPPLEARTDMDRWALAELGATVADVRANLDAYRTHPAARRLADFIDALSNWYVRRNRARFWAEGASQDKAAAFATLFEALDALSRLLAPFLPFLSEALYQNLGRRVTSAPESVHLSALPALAEAYVDDAMREDMDVARTVVGLGQRVRAQHRIKVRQPLSRAVVAVTSARDRQRVERFADAIADELNVREVVPTDQPEQFVEFKLVPNFRMLGPKLGRAVPECKKVLAASDGSALYRQLTDANAITLELASGAVTLGPEDIEIRLEAKEGFAAAADRGRVVVLDTHVDAGLRAEGLAREAINRIQRARKTMELAYEARIHISYRAEKELYQALQVHAERIAKEVLAVSFGPAMREWVAEPEADGHHTTDVEGIPFSFAIEVAEESAQ